MSRGMRGKYAEGQVRKVLKTMESASFVWTRWPDAHAGSRTPALADFLICSQGQLILLEVKECKHTFRLPYANFPPDQIARMRNWTLAGSRAYTLVYFSESKEWFLAGLDWWYANRVLEKNGKVVGSWDTTGLLKFTEKELSTLLKSYL